jgi:hypothetical protein
MKCAPRSFRILLMLAAVCILGCCGCAQRSNTAFAPQPTAGASERAPFCQPHGSWMAPQVRPYTVGRYVDGREGDLLHETHTVYRIEAGAHPNRLLPDALLLGPGSFATNTTSLSLLRDALTVELHEQRAASQALVSQAQALDQALQHLDAQAQEFQGLARKGQQIQRHLQVVSNRLDALEAHLSQLPLETSPLFPADASGKPTEPNR